jgi:hypothetical protein
MATATAPVPRPIAGEYNEYYERYISLVDSTDVLGILANQGQRFREVLGRLSDTQGNFAYAPGKWSIKEVVGHVVDTERIFSYRALRIGRGDQTPIEGFEQDDYIRNGGFGQHSLSDLLAEHAAVRSATLALFRLFDQAAWVRRGTANNKEISVRALAYIAAGHERHHQGILQEKYLSALR